MLELSDVMLCAASSVAIEQTITALERSCRDIRFGDVVFFSDKKVDLTDSAIRWESISPLRGAQAYSHFMIKELGRRATRPFVLIVQWDGYVLDYRRWNPEFLSCDYIGAPWPQFGDNMTVGNGGFSLRSRHLLETLAGGEFPPLHPEDMAICRVWRRRLEQHHGIRFANETLAAEFSSERSGNPHTTFGFHGAFNMPDILSEDEMALVTSTLPTHCLFGRDGAELIRHLASRGSQRLAWRLACQRLLAAPLRWKEIDLLLALARLTITRRSDFKNGSFR